MTEKEKREEEWIIENFGDIEVNIEPELILVFLAMMKIGERENVDLLNAWIDMATTNYDANLRNTAIGYIRYLNDMLENKLEGMQELTEKEKQTIKRKLDKVKKLVADSYYNNVAKNIFTTLKKEHALSKLGSIVLPLLKDEPFMSYYYNNIDTLHNEDIIAKKNFYRIFSVVSQLKEAIYKYCHNIGVELDDRGLNSGMLCWSISKTGLPLIPSEGSFTSLYLPYYMAILIKDKVTTNPLMEYSTPYTLDKLREEMVRISQYTGVITIKNPPPAMQEKINTYMWYNDSRGDI